MTTNHKTKVICDTNIWYKLGSGEFQKPDPLKYDLICTFVNVKEIVSSNNFLLLSKFEEIKNACRAILEYADGYIFENPIEYLKNELTDIITISEGKLFDLIPLITKIDKLNREELDLITLESIKWYQFLDAYFVFPVTSALKKDRELILGNNKKFREIIKNPRVLSLEREKVKEQILYDLTSQYKYLDRKLMSKINYSNVELYINARIAYIHKLKLDKIMTVQRNDVGDLFQLIYVNRDTLYWTNEGRWKDIIGRARMSSYLFH